MKLPLSRSQKQSGMVKKEVVFCLDARSELDTEEQEAVRKYKLGKQMIYNSATARRRFENGIADSEKNNVMSMVKGLASVAMAHLALNITIDSLTNGHHIEAKSLDELMEAEEAITQACKNLKGYLGLAATFDGREQVVEF